MAVYKSIAPKPSRLGLIQGLEDDGLRAVTAEVVYLQDDAQPTGLCDLNGIPIYRFRDPIGFHIKR